VLVTILAVADAELMRFAGTHLGSKLVQTYVNPAAASELPRTLLHDAGGPFLGVVLVTLAPWLVWRWQGRVAPVVGAASGWRAHVSALRWLALAATLSWIWVRVIWPGEAREWKLLPPLALMRSELLGSDRPPQPEAVAQQAAAALRQAWQRGHRGDPALFAVPDAPLVHLTPHRACAAAAARLIPLPAGLDCQQDGDRDGVPLARDCDDRRADVHPAAVDTPADGVDQDCSGTDAEPWNVLVLVLESHRALSVGHVTGGASWTPQLDALAARGLAHRRTVANGLPTIASFMALHTGMLPCAGCVVATDFAATRLPSLPSTLRQHGYYTRFFSAADPAWDNQRAWLRHWYDDIDYDRSREEDAPMFEHMAAWLRDQMPAATAGRPFFVLAMTRSNHFPFERVAGVPRTGDDSWPARMRDTMGYTDAAMGRLLATVAAQPWARRTLIVVTGDHGFPLGEHGHRHLFQTIRAEATAVPLVWAGDHPELLPLHGRLSDAPSSHVDVAPTVLDLLGIDPSGPWQGRSLVGDGEGQSWTIRDSQWATEWGDRRLLVDGNRPQDRDSWQVFDRKRDLREDHPLPAGVNETARAAELAAVAGWLYDLYRGDRILPPWLEVAIRPASR
jgi:hypothetical protein